MSIEHGDIAWESEVVAAHHGVDRTPMETTGDPIMMSEEWTLAHARFHQALLSACPNQRLRNMAGSLRDAAELYRRWSRPIGHDDNRDVQGEHRALVAASWRGDATFAKLVQRLYVPESGRVLVDGMDLAMAHLAAQPGRVGQHPCRPPGRARFPGT